MLLRALVLFFDDVVGKVTVCFIFSDKILFIFMLKYLNSYISDVMLF